MLTAIISFMCSQVACWASFDCWLGNGSIWRLASMCHTRNSWKKSNIGWLGIWIVSSPCKITFRQCATVMSIYQWLQLYRVDHYYQVQWFAGNGLFFSNDSTLLASQHVGINTHTTATVAFFLVALHTRIYIYISDGNQVYTTKTTISGLDNKNILSSIGIQGAQERAWRLPNIGLLL